MTFLLCPHSPVSVTANLEDTTDIQQDNLWLMMSPFEIRLVMYNPNLMLDLRIFQADYLGEKLFVTEPLFWIL